MTKARTTKGERGAALIVVLLLVATLAFILLSISNVITSSVARSSADRIRSASFWQAAAGEELARKALEKYFEAAPPKMAAGEGLFADARELPIEGGKATLMFRDATRCFNINALVAGEDGQFSENAEGVESFIRLMTSIGLGAGEAARLADVIVDYMDSDSINRPQGAEDGFYTALPVPYRTGGQLIMSVSELQALDRVSRSIYRRIRPYLCALDSTDPTAINGNLLRADAHASLAAALAPEEAGATVRGMTDAINALPPGGVSDPGEFRPPLNDVPGISVTSNLIEALVRLEVNDLIVEEKLLFEVKAGSPPRLLARAFGDDF